jgi:putative ABC transport system ATP-binding protein
MSNSVTLINLEGVMKIFTPTAWKRTRSPGSTWRSARRASPSPASMCKSTLLSILGLLDTPTEGTRAEWAVVDLPLSERARAAIARSAIFQSFNLIGDLTVYENVELPLTYRGMKASERKERVMAALEKVGMSHRAKHRPASSSGQQQRVASPARWAVRRRFCWRTNRPATSTRRTARRS